MRPHTIVLLLVLAVAEAVIPCDLSLITGYKPGDIHFDNDTKTLVCLDTFTDNMEANLARFNSVNYESLKCDEFGGWIGLTRTMDETGIISVNESKLADATSSLSIVCEKACSVRIWSGPEHFDQATRTLTCSSPNQSLSAIQRDRFSFNSETKHPLYPSLRCDEIKEQWLYKNEFFAREGGYYLEVRCVSYCESTGDGVKVDKFENSVDRHDDNIKISCADSFNLYYSGVRIKSNEAKCSLADGWMSTDGPLLVRSEPHFECRKAPPSCAFTLSSHNNNISNELAFEESRRYKDYSKYLACRSTNQSLKAIAVDSQHYERLKCDHVDGWIGITNDVEKKIANATSPLTVSCVEYCAVSGSQIIINVDQERRDRKENFIKVSCGDKSVYENLVHNAKIIGGRYAEFFCTLSDGWHREYHRYAMENTSFLEPLKLECKAEPCAYFPSRGAGGLGWTGKSFRCYDGDNNFNAIEFNSKRYTSLTCDKKEGWKDGNTTIADASVPLDFKCVEYCGVSGDVKIQKNENIIEVNCHDSVPELINERRHLIDNKAECSFDNGWMFIKGSFSTERKEFECRPAPHPCIFEEIQTNHLIHLQSKFDSQAKKTTLTCKGAENTPSEIVFLSNRYASLECDEIEGWKAGNQTIANSLSRMIVTCVSKDSARESANGKN